VADITLRIQGDAGGAVDATSTAAKATTDLGRASADASKASAEEVAKATVKWQQYAEVAKAALKAVVDFGVASVKAYAEAERVSRQLERAAGDLTETFEGQADAIEAALAVDADLIKQQQTLLVQWGAAPSQVEGATRAVLDYAAATGKDALSATNELIKGVESGGEKFKQLGVQYVATGDKTKDLAALTEALSKKFGGAAQADADSLVGGARAAEIAFGNLQEAFGEFIADAGQKTGVVAALTEAMRGLSTAMGGNTEYNRAEAKGKLYDEMNLLQGTLSETGPWNSGGGITREMAEARLAEIKAMLAPGGQFGPRAPLPTTATGTTKLGDEKKAKAAAEDYWTPGSAARLGGEIDEQGGPTSMWAREEEKERAAFIAELTKTHDVVSKAEKDEQAKRLDQLNDFFAAEAKAEKEATEQTLKTIKEAGEKIRAEEQHWRAVGDQLGAAMVGALSEQIAKMADGGEFDMAEFMTEIAISVIGIAAAAVGTAYGMPEVGAAVGNLAGMGIRAATRDAKKHHDGGWVDADRWHGGGWAGIGFDEVPIVAQPGERMLSRTEVQRMGGPASVDSMASRGGRGGGVTVQISTFDAKSTREFFEDRGGQGFRRAVQSGRGDIARMFGEGVVT